MTASDPETPSPNGRRYRSLPRSIWVLGFGSLFMDMSSELVHSLLPVFLVSVLGASMVTVGLIEGIAEATAAITKVFSGALSDYFRKRKFLVVLGYGLSALSKPLFPLATAVGWVFTARFVDRVGKGIRGAPRDALVAELVSADRRGAAYGLRQALDSVGAFLGPLLAVLFMVWLDNDLERVLWVAVVPAFVAVTLLAIGVREPDRQLENHHSDPAATRGWTLSDARNLPLRYWLVVGLGGAFTLARFSEAFLVLRAQSVGLGLAMVPLIMIVMNVVYAFLAYPAGIAADRSRPRSLLILGLFVLIAADAVFALASSPLATFVGAGLWGLHMALTQGLLSKLVADTAPDRVRGTAFGVFNLVTGVVLLLASVLAGGLWNLAGPRAPFVAGGVFAAVAVVGLLLYPPKSETRVSATT